MAFFAGLLFKETAFVVPGLLLAYDFLYRREAPGEILRGLPRYLPYAGVLGAYVAMRLKALGSFAPSWGVNSRVTPWEIFLSVPVLVAQYVGMLIRPVNLNYLRVFEPERSLGWRPVAALLLVAALVAAAFLLRRAQPLLAFAVAWFLVTLAPSLAIPNFTENVFAERYLYVPSLGFFIVVAWGWLELRKRPAAPLRWGSYGALTALSVLSAVIILRRIPDWKDNLTLYRKTVEQSPRSAFVRSGLGYTYYRLGKVDLAIEQYRLALELNPLTVQTYINMALAQTTQGHPEEAIRYLRQALRLNPQFMPTWQALGLVYVKQGDWDHAVECYRRALVLDREPARTEVRLGVALAHQGNLEEAIAHLRKALVFAPDDETAWRELGLVYSRRQQWDQAIECYRKALERSPADAVALTAIGVALQNKGEPAQAMAAYRKAIEAQPGSIEARINLGIVLSESGQADEAIDQLLTALRLNPRSPQVPLAHFNLGLICGRQGRWEEAAVEYEQALALKPEFAPARQQLAAARAHLAKRR